MTHKALTTAKREMIDAAVAEGKVTKVKPGKARGVNKRTAPMTSTKPTKAAPKQRAAAPKAKPSGTFTSVQLAAEYNINPKTLRARIRRNIDKWEPLFVDGQRHVFKDNAKTRKAVAALLNA